MPACWFRTSPPPRRSGPSPGCASGPSRSSTGAPPATRVVEANAAAREHGVAPGMPEAEARTRCPVLALRPATPELVDSSTQALLQACLGVSPRIEEAGPGIVHVEIDGLERLFGSDAAIAHRLARLAARVGLPARVGVADSRVAARVAARQANARVTVVPPGGDRQSLATAPLDALELSDDLLATLARWGLTTLGELAALPRKGLATGSARRACAPTTSPTAAISPRSARTLRRRSGKKPWASTGRSTRSPRWRSRWRWCWGGSPRASPPPASPPTPSRCAWAWPPAVSDDRLVPLAYPLREPGPMLALLRLSLEAHPPPAPVTRIAVSASAVALRPAPRELWEPAGPAPRDLETVLARLVTLATPQNVGSPVITDSHRPDAFVLAPFVPPARASRQGSQGRESLGTRASSRRRG